MKKTERTLDERSINADPILQFKQWLDEAIKEGIPEPTAMTLATVSKDRNPSARIVLLKDIGNRGFVFYTNYLSRKGKELDATPLAALVFLWKELERQVRIEGTIQKISPDESDQYFHTRPRESQISALISPQSTVVTDRSELERMFAEKEKQYQGQPIPRPKHWGGYCLEPTSIEFWQGRSGRLHDRLLFTRVNNGWTIQRLAP